MTEQEIQRAVFQHLKARGAPGTFAFHCPNGGYRKPKESAIFKGLGVKAGVPDVIAIKNGKFFGLELKAFKGVTSPAQIEVLQTMQKAGAEVAVVHSLEAAIQKLEQWGLLKGSVQA